MDTVETFPRNTGLVLNLHLKPLHYKSEFLSKLVCTKHNSLGRGRHKGRKARTRKEQAAKIQMPGVGCYTPIFHRKH
jgi:hypothetical protein